MMTVKQHAEETREDIRKVFGVFDEDGQGNISLRELRKVANELGETVTDDVLQDMIDRIDSNADGEASFDDFYNLMIKKTFI